MNTITLTLDAEAAMYLRNLLAEAATEGRRLEERTLEDGDDNWGGEWPDAQIEAAHNRSAMAERILGQLS